MTTDASSCLAKGKHAYCLSMAVVSTVASNIPLNFGAGICYAISILLILKALPSEVVVFLTIQLFHFLKSNG